MTRVIEGEPVKVTRVIETEPVVTKVVIEGEPVITKVTRVIGGDPLATKATRVIERQPTITKVTRVIAGGALDTDGKTGPDFSKITTIHSNLNQIDEESERITKIIQEGGRFAAAKRAPAGMKRRARPARRHSKPRE